MKIGKDRRSGVALVIVLGLVAVLLIMCVAFSINMRVERAGAANLRHAAMARQLAKGAMAVAIQRIDDDLLYHDGVGWYSDEPGADVYVRVFTNRNTGVSARKNLWNGTFVSYNDVGRMGRSEEHIPASFFTPEVDRYFPSGLAFKGYAAKYRTGSGHNVQTKDIFQPEWVPVYSGGGNLIGRYSFFAMETTGLLDISVASHTNRWMGYDPGEIALSDDILDGELILPSGKKIDDVVKDLDSDSRYESFAEFRALREDNSDKAKNFFSNLRSLTTFSYAPSETNDSSKILIGRKEGESQSSYVDRLRADKAKIIAAFHDSGLTAGQSFGAKDCEQARWAYLGLIDFVDDDDEMEDDDKIKPWERPATENMPLPSGFIANIVIECQEIPIEDGEDENGDPTYVADPDNCELRMSANFKMPFVFPFIEQNDISDFDFNVRACLGIGDNCVSKSEIIPDKVVDGTDAFGGPLEDNSVYDLIIEGDWTDGFDKEAEDAPCLLDGLEFKVHAASATCIANGDEQHMFPPSKEDFNGSDFNQWMTVVVNMADEGIEFDPDDFEPVPDPSGKPTLKKWRTNIIVWADILDPRFSSLTMRDNDHYGDPMYYRRSHNSDIDTDPDFHYTVPVKRMKELLASRCADLNSFSAGDVVITEKEFTNGQYVASGKYFHGSANLNSGSDVPFGASPTASFILNHPRVASQLYGMNMDGLRVDDYEDSSSTDTPKMKWRMYVKNAPLESVGELGYLPIGIWQTIRLYDYNNAKKINFASQKSFIQRMTKFNHLPSDDNPKKPSFHSILDKFIVRDDAVKGRVNLNTISDSVLASVFYGLPVFTPGDPYFQNPERDNPNYRVGPDDARNLAQAILEERADAGGTLTSITNLCNIFRWGDDVFLNGADMSWAAQAAAFSASPSGAQDSFGEFEREAIIRNSCGLFTTRGQSFIIVARGESYSPIFGRTTVEGGTVNAARTAIAQIWRDTEKDADGKYPIAIQFFKIIDD